VAPPPCNLARDSKTSTPPARSSRFSPPQSLRSDPKPMPIPIVTQPKSKIRARLLGICSRRASARPANPVHALSHRSILGILCALPTSLRFVAASVLTVRLAQAAQVPSSFLDQSQAEADQRSPGCISCHTTADEPTMHPTKTVQIA